MLKPFKGGDKGGVQADDAADDGPSWLERHFKLDVVKEKKDTLGATLSRSRKQRESRLEISDDNLGSVSESGAYQTGLGNSAHVIKDLVAAGSVTTLIIADDIGLVTGARGLAKYGQKEGAEFVFKRFDDNAVQLFKVVDGKAVRQSLNEGAERSVRRRMRSPTQSGQRSEEMRTAIRSYADNLAISS